MRDVAALLARILISGIFVMGGIMKFINLADTARMISEKGLPMPPTLAMVSVATEILGGVMILFGFYTRVGAAILIAFLIPVTFIMHAFWSEPADLEQLNNFVKNVTIIGGLFALIASGGGAFSIDGAIAKAYPKAAPQSRT